jgi:hypothetical protein
MDLAAQNIMYKWCITAQPAQELRIKKVRKKIQKWDNDESIDNTWYSSPRTTITIVNYVNVATSGKCTQLFLSSKLIL